MRELESSVALCESILQKVQTASEGREQLLMQLQVQTKELAELNEQLKLYKPAGVLCVCSVCDDNYSTRAHACMHGLILIPMAPPPPPPTRSQPVKA